MIDNWLDSLRTGALGAAGTANLASMSRGRRSLVHLMRVASTIGRELTEGQITLRAMGLVYTTLLSLVPLLAVSFSVLKAFGVHNQLQTTLLNVLAPLGEQGIRIADQIVGFVENIKVGALGALGLALLIYTVVSLMQKIEASINHTWRIRRSRGMPDRFSRYLSVVMVGPVLVFSAMGISASLMSSDTVQQVMSIEPFGALFRFLAGLVPYFMLTAAFTFVYAYIPNTRVRFSAALAGGLFAALLWSCASWAFAAFIVNSTNKWTAVYSSLAILMLFMVWLYVGWTILLAGVAVSFYVQNPQYIKASREELRLTNRHTEVVGLEIARLIAARFLRGEEPYSSGELSARFAVPVESVQALLRRMVHGGVLSMIETTREVFQPARDLQNISVLEVWLAIRGSPPPVSSEPDPVAQLMVQLDQALEAVSAELTLRDFALQVSLSNGQGMSVEADQSSPPVRAVAAQLVTSAEASPRPVDVSPNA
jgi:membrane protein